MENLRNRIDETCKQQKKFYSNWTSKPSYTSQKKFRINIQLKSYLS